MNTGDRKLRHLKTLPNFLLVTSILTHQAHARCPQDDVHGGPVLLVVCGRFGRHSQAHLIGHEAGTLIAVVVSVHREVHLNVGCGDITRWQ